MAQEHFKVVGPEPDQLPEVSKGRAEEGAHLAPEARGERWGGPGPVR